MQQIAPNIFQLDVPLPNSPLKETHCFLIRGKKRHLLVDTAFNTDVCEQAIMLQLTQSGVSIEDTDIFVTHMHVDHSGLISRLKRPENTIYSSLKDKELIDGFQNPSHWSWITDNNVWMGVPEPYSLKAEEHIAYRMRNTGLVDITVLSEGDKLPIGDYSFQVIGLPGHTPGQIGLWEPDHGFLFCGDHILSNISPNITAWDLKEDYLRMFIDSLKQIRNMPVKRLFPAHRRPPEDINARIDQMLEHHEKRLLKIMDTFKDQNRPMTAYDMAFFLDWKSDKPIAEMLPQQRWFACSETLAHLQHLRFLSKLDCEEKGQTFYYSLKK